MSFERAVRLSFGIFIKWLGAHKDYNKIDARTVQYDDQTYPDKSRP
jgi:hypothetical protein